MTLKIFSDLDGFRTSNVSYCALISPVGNLTVHGIYRFRHILGRKVPRKTRARPDAHRCGILETFLPTVARNRKMPEPEELSKFENFDLRHNNRSGQTEKAVNLPSFRFKRREEEDNGSKDQRDVHSDTTQRKTDRQIMKGECGRSRCLRRWLAWRGASSLSAGRASAKPQLKVFLRLFAAAFSACSRHKSPPFPTSCATLLSIAA